MFCMNKGETEIIIDKMFNGEINIDKYVVTEYICKRYPYAVSIVRPKLLIKKEKKIKEPKLDLDMLFNLLNDSMNEDENNDDD